MLNTIDNIKALSFPYAAQENGKLVYFEAEDNSGVPFKIQRTFNILVDGHVSRGKHAHIACQQLLVCLHGKCKVICQDGDSTKEYELTHPEQGLLIPPHIWAEQQYLSDSSILQVFCDQHFDEADYIRDFDEFIKFRKYSEDLAK